MSDRGGFTILEAVVSASVCLLVTMTSLKGALLAHQTSLAIRQRCAAASLAAGTLAWSRSPRVLPPAGESREETAAGSTSYTSVTTWEETADPAVWKIRCTVSWSDSARRRRSLAMDTMVWKPQ